VVDQTLVLEPWEWKEGAADCIRAIKEHMRKRGFDWVEVWADQAPDAVHVHYVYPPRNVPQALYRGRT
jgi:hypothetical protein